MWSSTLPTGTVRGEGDGSRTFPEQSPRQPVRQDGDQQAELRAEIERLHREKREAEAEVERLESQVELLRTQLADREESHQAMVDRYERVIAELETAAATAPTTGDADGGRDRGAGGPAGSEGLLARLTGWLG